VGGEGGGGGRRGVERRASRDPAKPWADETRRPLTTSSGWHAVFGTRATVPTGAAPSPRCGSKRAVPCRRRPSLGLARQHALEDVAVVHQGGRDELANLLDVRP